MRLHCFFIVHDCCKYSRLIGRSNPRLPFPTIITKQSTTGKLGTVGHPSRDRLCTRRKLARAQGFPDSMLVVNESVKYAGM